MNLSLYSHLVRCISNGPEKAYHTIKYSTKPQQDIENPWALHLHAFDKASERLLQDSDDPIALGRRRVQSMCCTLTNPHEVLAPMACLYIINESVMYSSHSFVKLHLVTILRALFQQLEQLDVTLEGDGSERVFKPSSVWFDYVFAQLHWKI
ncbi:unnamed protein product [Phytophthora fragariaefolia]|uniref:Unnamed protein product n=1 Tax=Phytophthora fragariaefolia TaxID=1490495 RepID=A0A9W6U6S3_9STRA|nr:unnamed protein product [Phytophthora fragariaefolia]